MMLVPTMENTTPFSLEAPTQLYQNPNFATRAKFFEIFLPKNAQFPKNNPPYPSSIFLDQPMQIISMISHILGYHSYQCVDEPILGFLSIFSTDIKPSMILNFNKLLDEISMRNLLLFLHRRCLITPLF